MPISLLTWQLVVECSVAWDYWESQPCYSANHQLVNIKAISASHEAMRLVLVYKTVLNYESVMFL